MSVGRHWRQICINEVPHFHHTVQWISGRTSGWSCSLLSTGAQLFFRFLFKWLRIFLGFFFKASMVKRNTFFFFAFSDSESSRAFCSVLMLARDDLSGWLLSQLFNLLLYSRGCRYYILAIYWRRLVPCRRFRKFYLPVLPLPLDCPRIW